MSRRFAKKSKVALQRELTPLQYAVTQENATERRMTALRTRFVR